MQSALSLKQAYQEAYTAFFNEKAPEVRISEAGGFYVKSPVSRHYTGEDFVRAIRFFVRGAN